jgi:hypothetical protein
LIFFIVEEEGAEVKVFFLLHWTCAKRRGRGVSFFQKTFFFILEWIGRGIMVFILYI